MHRLVLDRGISTRNYHDEGTHYADLLVAVPHEQLSELGTQYEIGSIPNVI